MTVATGEQRINSQDGTELFVKSYNVPSPKAQLLVTHGYLEHCGRYDEFARAMAAQSISVTVWDCRGHGQSSGDRGYLDNWDSYQQDISAVKSTLRPGVPTFLLGHSNGGVITMDYLLHNNHADFVQGVIFSSPFFAPAEDIGAIKKLAAKLLGGYFPGLQIPADLKSESLSSDIQKQLEHSKDEMNLKSATAGWAYHCMEAQERVQNTILQPDDGVFLSVPLLFAYGAADRVAKASLNDAIADKLKSDDKTVLRREGERHEILNEVKRDELFDTIAQWVLKRV